MPAEGNVGIAFALVIGAGLSTTVGACAAFWAKLASPKTLAVGLGLSAGVMLYVSFVEIFIQKGVDALTEGGWGEDGGYRYGTLLLFGGMVITGILDLIVHFISDRASKKKENDAAAAKAADLESGKKEAPDSDQAVHLEGTPDDIPEDAAETIDTYVSNDHHRFGLQKMGLLTALAIGIHNLPEGLATFIAALSDPLSGLAIAVAIALHNIPEGVCVAMPVYYATGSRAKGFMWAFLSGLSEPIGGLLGYAVLFGNRMSDVAYGVLFCVVAGMMVYISVMELIPTALKYDPSNRVTSKSIVAGMLIMAASLLMFTI